MEPAKAVYPRDANAWGDKEDAYLLESLAANKSIDEINTRLRRHPTTIAKRITQLQNPVKPVAPPQDQAPELQTWDDKVAGQAIKDTVLRPANYLKKWTEADIETLKTMLKAGSKPEEIAEKLQRTSRAISCRINDIIISMTVAGSVPEEISVELSVPIDYVVQYLQYNSKRVEDAKATSLTKVAKAKPAAATAPDDVAKLLPICVEIRDLLKVLVERLPAKP